MTGRIFRVLVAAGIVGAAVLLYLRWQPHTGPAEVAPAAIGTPGGPSTSRDDLRRAIDELDARVRRHPADAEAAAALADALLRQSRVTGNPGLAVRAEAVLRAALDARPDQYDALRMLAAVLAAQHRFREAIATAARARRYEPRDPWNLGVIGDASLELGEYAAAFAAFDEMLRLRPSAAAYARAAYARELQGDLAGALRLMTMARDATTSHDPESQAWHDVQLGDLHLQLGQLADAERQYRQAVFTFPDHPLAEAGLARLDAARGDLQGALRRYEAIAGRGGALPEIYARMGELQLALGRTADAGRSLALAEHGWKYDTPEPAHAARFMATHGRRPAEALALAQRAAADRRDIGTMDALAWAAFRAGRLDLAREAARDALRTGTRDRTVLYHAAAIHEASGDASAARALRARALAGPSPLGPPGPPAHHARRTAVTAPARRAMAAPPAASEGGAAFSTGSH